MADIDRHLDLPRGFHDSGPDAMSAHRALQAEWFDTCALSGYQPIAVPPVGFQDTFTSGHNAAGQRTFRFADRGGRKLALVSDSLPAILRAAHARGLPEQRLSHCCPVFRYERRPRRHFHHLGLLEIATRPTSPAERQRATLRLARTLARFLSPRLPVTFTVTDPGIWHTLAADFVAEHQRTEYLNTLHRLPSQDRPACLRRDGAPDGTVELAEALCSDPTLSRSTDHALPGTLPAAVRQHIDAAHELAAGLRANGARTEIDLTELHASEFHDGPSFLIRPRNDQRRLLGDGGTYGAFASRFIKTPAAAHSAVIGLERLAELTITDPSRPESAAEIALLAHNNPAAISSADQLATALRADGIRVWDLVLTRPLRRHLRDIAPLAIPYSVLIGTRDLDTATYTIRDQHGGLHQIHRDQLANWIRDHTEPPR